MGASLHFKGIHLSNKEDVASIARNGTKKLWSTEHIS